MVETSVSWDLLNDDKQEEWGISAFLSDVRFSKGVLHYAFSKFMARKLYNPDIYGKIRMDIVRRFKKGHALSLYENCIRFQRIGTTGSLPVDTVKHLLGVSALKAYSNFSAFNQAVLTPALSEVNKLSNIIVECKRDTIGNAVTHIKFNIKRNPDFKVLAKDKKDSCLVMKLQRV